MDLDRADRRLQRRGDVGIARPVEVSTLLTAIDKDTGAAYLYAMSHANGPSTVIKLLGKLPGTYTDPIYFLRTHGTDLRGE